MPSGRIKGITIEIGGDTKKLDKALAGTNKELSSTQKSLKDVERLLKMDPGNTELLAQKQRLLGDAVAANVSKLGTLKEAAKSADDALARGKAYEEKYRPLREEIEAVSASLDGLLDNQSRMEKDLASGKISAEAYDQFQTKVDETKAKLNSLKQAQKDLEAEFAGAKLNQSQYDAIQREIVETEEALRDAEKAFDKFDEASEKIGSTFSTISTGAGKVAGATKGISTAAAGVVAAAAATVPATDELRASLAMLDNNAQLAGVGVGATRDALYRLYSVTGEVDSSVEAISNLLQAGFTESDLQFAVENLAGAYLAFPDTMKIESLADSLQETLATGEATGQFAELLERLGYNTETFNEQLLFTRDGANQLSSALGHLSTAGMDETYKAFVANNEELLRSRESTLKFQETVADFAEMVLPFVSAVTQALSGMLEFFNSLPPEVQTVIGVVVLLLAAISPVAGVIASISAAVSLSTVAFAGWTPIILAVVAALAALAIIIGIVTGKKKDLESLDLSPSGLGIGSMPDINYSAGNVPHLARGTVTRANSPFLAVVGDNPTEPEVISPYSTIKRAAGDAMEELGGGLGGGSVIDVTLTLDGTVLARKQVPYLDKEYTRRGNSLIRNGRS